MNSFFKRHCVAVRMEPEKKARPRGTCSDRVDKDGRAFEPSVFSTLPVASPAKNKKNTRSL